MEETLKAQTRSGSTLERRIGARCRAAVLQEAVVKVSFPLGRRARRCLIPVPGTRGAGGRCKVIRAWVVVRASFPLGFPRRVRRCLTLGPETEEAGDRCKVIRAWALNGKLGLPSRWFR